ncbi:hypothetical protein C8J55DRAFT_317383 [Lentinula edodes]|uniref:Uncharacterized protein n=1 Tax=Lentinula lateritia TaxID=40482 RepID=A0A9W9DW34_9AGAR|nr:hypothetical protein C8J55DRAFT_317383 [Lentinula edodes]
MGFLSICPCSIFCPSNIYKMLSSHRGNLCPRNTSVNWDLPVCRRLLLTASSFTPKELNTSSQTIFTMACSRSFSGLIELELWLNLIPELSWLPEFICAHPLLRRIRFSMSRVQWNIDRIVPFILPFLNAIDEEGLADTFEFKAFSIARSSSTPFPQSTEPLCGWHVAGLWFCISEWSSRRLLQLAHTFFPQTSTLTIESPLPGSDCASINADEVIDCLSRFSSLRTVNLVYLFRNLKFGDLEFATAERYHGHLGIRTSHVQTDRAAEIEAALIWYTSCIAQRIPTIENFLIQEPPLRGWIHVNKGGISGSLRSLMQSEVNQLFSLYV